MANYDVERVEELTTDINAVIRFSDSVSDVIMAMVEVLREYTSDMGNTLENPEEVKELDALIDQIEEKVKQL